MVTKGIEAEDGTEPEVVKDPKVYTDSVKTLFEGLDIIEFIVKGKVLFRE